MSAVKIAGWLAFAGPTLLLAVPMLTSALYKLSAEQRLRFVREDRRTG